jgi:hypothetical protein
MNSLRRLFPIVLLSLSAVAFAQTDAQKSFDTLKTLQGSWQGTLDGKSVNVTMRATSMGNTLMHEVRLSGQPDDPISMFHLEGDHLFMTHYCDAGNEPHMIATTCPTARPLPLISSTRPTC